MTDNVTLPTTLPVRTFARIAFDISENPAYAAARSGVFPTIKVGGVLRVPLRLALAKIAGGDAEVLRQMTADFAKKLDRETAGQAA